jgi:hypothetical protein
MDEKHSNWLKKIGIAGFLFFLLKGIMWLIFGTAFYKWIKDLLIISSIGLSPVIIEAQTPTFFLNKPKAILPGLIQYNQPKLYIEASEEKPFFCKLEDQLNEHKKTYLKFRLGSLDYSNQLEYSKFLQQKQNEIYLK